MYRIRGADQKEYGPVAIEQIRQWLIDHRLNHQSLVQAEGTSEWKPLSSFPELAALLPPPLALPFDDTAVGPVRTNGLAITGLILGILSMTFGLVCCGALFSVPGLICSAIALSQINQNPERQTGKGLAIAGLILSTLGLIGWLLISLLFGAVSFIGQIVRELGR